jgi:2'-5' RNA ligase
MDSASAKQIVAYWLCPAEPDRMHFVELINDLAKKFGGPTFEPHVTLYVTDAAKENPDAVLAQVAKGWSSTCLSIHGLDYSDNFTKTFFVQFKPDADVTRLSSDLRRASAVQNDYELNPHLSLVYKAMAHETKRDLAHSIRLPFIEVRFDTVKAVISPAKIESRADVEAWRVVATQQLAE